MSQDFRIWIILGLIILISGCQPGGEPPYEIVGNSVQINNSDIFLSATPHTIEHSDWVELEFESKVFSGDIDFAFGFDTDLVRPTEVERWNPHNGTIEESYTCYYDFGYNATDFWCFSDDPNGTNIYFEHHYDRGNIQTQTAWWNVTVEKNWSNWVGEFNSIDYDFDGKNKWWYKQGQFINANQRYKIRYYLEIPYGVQNAKYDLAIKPSSETIPESIQNNHFYFLDPWYDHNLDSGLMRYYPFDIDQNDSTQYERNGTLQGTPTFTSAGCILGNCYLFDADADHINYTDLTLGQSFTISYWVNVTDLSQASFFEGHDFRLTSFLDTDNAFKFNTGNGVGWGATCNSAGAYVENTTYHVILTSNATDNVAYINNVSVCAIGNSMAPGTWDTWIGKGSASGGQYARGYYDEVGYWNRTLTRSEITALYNNGNGLPFRPNEINIDNMLIQPTILNPLITSINCSSIVSFITSESEGFNATLNWTNSSNGVLESQTNFVNKPNGTVISDNLTVSFSVDEVWNCSIYTITNSTEVDSINSSTITVLGLPINYTTFQRSSKNSTAEGDGVNFFLSMNITDSSLTPTNVMLLLNRTYFTSSATSSDAIGNAIIYNYTSAVTIPDGFGNSSGNLAPWNWTFTIPSVVNNGSTNNSNITIFSMDVGNCGDFGTLILNYTVNDEENRSVTDIAGEEIEGAIEIISKQSSAINFTYSNSTNNSFEVCISNSALNFTDYWLSATTKYSATDHAVEYHNIQNTTLTFGFLQNISLYDLFSDDSTEFRLTFIGSDFLPVENALVNLDRQYLIDNTFETVELPKTDSNGETVLHMVRNDIIYNIRIVKNGEILGNFENIIAFCDDFTIGDCKIELNAFDSTPEIFSYYEDLGIIFTNPEYNTTTRKITFTFSSSDGTNKLVGMEVTRSDIFGNRTVCDESLNSAGGTLTCVVPSTIEDATLFTAISVNGVLVSLSGVDLDPSTYGAPGFVIMFMFIMSFVLMFSNSKNGVLFSLILGVAGGIGLGIITGSMIGAGAAGLWIIIIVLIGIWKLNKERPQ